MGTPPRYFHRVLGWFFQTAIIAGLLTLVPVSNSYAGSCAGAGNLTTQCPAGEMLTGFQNGSPLCIPLNSVLAGVTCPAGEVLSGFNPDGTPKCDPAAGGGVIGGPFTVYQCPHTQTANGVSSGPWASYGCNGQIQLNPSCRVMVYPQSQFYPCTPIGTIN